MFMHDLLASTARLAMQHGAGLGTPDGADVVRAVAAARSGCHHTVWGQHNAKEVLPGIGGQSSNRSARKQSQGAGPILEGGLTASLIRSLSERTWVMIT